MSQDINDNYKFTARLLTGGESSSSKDNEWDKYIVGSTLDGSINAGDNNVWNWSGNYVWTSTTPSGTTANRAKRGSATIGTYVQSATSYIHADSGFRPVLLIETLLFNKSFILSTNEYKKWDGSNKLWQTVSATLPSIDTFKDEGMDDLSAFTRKATTIKLPMDDNTATGTTLGSGKVFKEKVDLKKFFDLNSLNVK